MGADKIKKFVTFFIDYVNSVKSRISPLYFKRPPRQGDIDNWQRDSSTQILGIIFVPIITRIYPPAIYGTLAVFISLVTILVDISAFRYELAIPIPEKDEDAEYFSSCLWQ